MKTLVSLVALAMTACATPVVSGPRLIERIDAPDARVMWVGAHPDDETLAGPILARAAIGMNRPGLILALTRGEGGACALRLGCGPDVGSVRTRELAHVAHAYGVELEQHAFFNAPLPKESFPTRAQLARIWRRQADPSLIIARAIRRFRPTVLLTFDPDRGFTDHPEHQLASRHALAAVRRAADLGDPALRDLPPHTVDATYLVLNRYFLTRLVGLADPASPTEVFDTHVACGAPRRACLDVALEISKLHRTQAVDMGLARSLRPQMRGLYLRRVDPLVEPTPDPEMP